MWGVCVCVCKNTAPFQIACEDSEDGMGTMTYSFLVSTNQITRLAVLGWKCLILPEEDTKREIANNRSSTFKEFSPVEE